MPAGTRGDLVVVGRVVGAHGLRGHLKVRWLGDGPEQLRDADEIWLARGEDDAAPRSFRARTIGQASGGDLRMELVGVGDRDAAEACKGQLLLVAAVQLEALAEDEFYWHELVGCRVDARSGETIGVVRELIETGAHDLLVVEAADGQQHLIPTAREFVSEIDIAGKRILVDLIPGLLDSG